MIFVYITIAAACVCVDQLTKLWLYGKNMSIIGDVLWLNSPSLNTGAGWNIFSGQLWFLILVSVLCSALIIYLLVSKRWGLSITIKIALAFVLGGAVGNLIDRIVYGGVRDFIYLKFIDFPIFNFADIFITIGGILLAIAIILAIFKPSKKEEKSYGGKTDGRN
jgi:signal peptidase II